MPGPKSTVSHANDSTDTSSVPTMSQRTPSTLEDDPPPPYGSVLGQIHEDEESGTRATIADDGRVNIRIDQQTKGLSSLLVPALRSQLDLTATGPDRPYVPPSLERPDKRLKLPSLNIVIHVVGSRGDVQPFIALGKVLKEKHGHRVRLATHPVFKAFVEENGLEFFNIAGDPSELMAFMVKNPGLMPGFDTMRRGDIGKRRREIGNMIKRCWRSCIEAGDGSGVEASDKNIEDWASVDSGIGMDEKAKPFVADAIIANPPSFAHIHCAEKLGIPLHLMFTMPWSPTQSFPHPLANIQSTNADTNMTNFISYALVDMMTWQGLGDVINKFREKSLNLEPISLTWAPGMLARLHIPWTYCWSPALIPKPRDWGPYITISGFYFLSLASGFTPAPDLAAFLDSGPPPVYIGFGSIVVDDPNGMTKLIFDAVKKSGQRALVSQGWGGFGADQIGIPDGVFMLGNVPHDWLFKRVSCVVHHGGAGTTAAGIACGKPTVVVPFFGDQPFWGHMVARAGAGPPPIAYKNLSSDALAKSISKALEPASIEKAKGMADKISSERGSEVGAQSFHQQLDVDKLRCQLCPARPAVWRIKRTDVRLSAFAATVLAGEGLLDFKELKLYRPREYDTEEGPWDPITGGASALVGTLGSMAMGIADLPVAALKALKIHPEAQKSRRASKNDNVSGIELTSPNSPAPDGQRRRAESVKGELRKTSPTSSRGSSPAGEEQAMALAIGNKLASHSAEESSRSSRSGSHGQILTPGSTSTQSQSSTPRTASQTPKKAPTPSNPAEKPQFDVESALSTTQGALRFASAGIKSPMDFTLNLARGFHNAPKLYHDETVRPPPKITDFSSGVRAASKEFGYGFYDGISGLVTQPLDGAKKEGFGGFVKGIGKGFGGVVLKPGAAIWGIPGYTSRGIYKELTSHFGASVEGYIIAARTAQGYEDLRNSNVRERAFVLEDWKEMKRYIYKKKTPGEGQFKELCDRIFARCEREDAQRAKSGLKPDLQRMETTATASSGVYSPESADSTDVDPLSRVHTAQKAATNAAMAARGTSQEDAEFEQAILRSVRETSRGNPEEDDVIERAIRQSVQALRARESAPDDAEIKETIGRSLAETKGGQGEQDEDGEQLDEELKRALALSKEEHERGTIDEESAKREEEIVMKYVMKQSEEYEKVRREREAGQ